MPKYINLEDRFKEEIGGVQVYDLESKDCLISCKENSSSQNKVEASPLKGLGNEKLGTKHWGTKHWERNTGNETLISE